MQTVERVGKPHFPVFGSVSRRNCALAAQWHSTAYAIFLAVEVSHSEGSMPKCSKTAETVLSEALWAWQQSTDKRMQSFSAEAWFLKQPFA